MIDFEFVRVQIVRVADNHAICFGIEIDNVTRPQRSAGKSFSLADSEKLDAVVFGNEVPIDIVNLAAMIFVFAKVRTRKRFVIIFRSYTNYLTFSFVRDL